MRAASRLATVALLAGAITAPLLAGCGTTRGGAQAGDSTLASQVRAALRGDSAVRALNLSVEAVDGRVQLRGFAGSEAEISRAVELASDVAGVRAVRNEIRLRAESPAESPR